MLLLSACSLQLLVPSVPLGRHTGLSTDAHVVAGERALRMEHQASQVLAVRGGMHSKRGEAVAKVVNLSADTSVVIPAKEVVARGS